METDRRLPIHQTGSTAEVDNYRLLAIHSIFRKLYCTIIDRRIRSFVQLDDAQNGFRNNRRTTDNIILVQNLIRQTNRRKEGAYLFVADFRKDFATYQSYFGNYPRDV